MKHKEISEAALIERQEYLDELMIAQDLLKDQIEVVKHDIDNLIIKISKHTKCDK